MQQVICCPCLILISVISLTSQFLFSLFIRLSVCLVFRAFHNIRMLRIPLCDIIWFGIVLARPILFLAIIVYSCCIFSHSSLVRMMLCSIYSSLGIRQTLLIYNTWLVETIFFLIVLAKSLAICFALATICFFPTFWPIQVVSSAKATTACLIFCNLLLFSVKSSCQETSIS